MAVGGKVAKTVGTGLLDYIKAHPVATARIAGTVIGAGGGAVAGNALGIGAGAGAAGGALLGFGVGSRIGFNAYIKDVNPMLDDLKKQQTKLNTLQTRRDKLQSIKDKAYSDEFDDIQKELRENGTTDINAKIKEFNDRVDSHFNAKLQQATSVDYVNSQISSLQDSMKNTVRRSEVFKAREKIAQRSLLKQRAITGDPNLELKSIGNPYIDQVLFAEPPQEAKKFSHIKADPIMQSKQYDVKLDNGHYDIWTTGQNGKNVNAEFASRYHINNNGASFTQGEIESLLQSDNIKGYGKVFDPNNPSSFSFKETLETEKYNVSSSPLETAKRISQTEALDNSGFALKEWASQHPFYTAAAAAGGVLVINKLFFDDDNGY